MPPQCMSTVSEMPAAVHAGLVTVTRPDLVTLYQLYVPASVPASYREMVKIKFLLVLNQLGHPGTGW